MTTPLGHVAATLGAVELSDDIEWIDEFEWSPVAQQIEIAGSGALIVEESAQLAGRHITLRSGSSGNQHWGTASHATVVALRALADTARALGDALPLVLPDGRTTTVMFRHGDKGFEARPLRHVWPAEASDIYLITLRLQAVSAILLPEE